jgi:hypothetical protein
MAKSKQQAEAEKVREDEAPEPREEEQPDVEEDEDEEPEQLSHWEAAHRVCRAIDGDTTLSELVYDADRLVVKGGGKSNEDRAYARVYEVLQSLQELGMLELNEEVTVHPLHRLPSANGQK